MRASWCLQAGQVHWQWRAACRAPPRPGCPSRPPLTPGPPPFAHHCRVAERLGAVAPRLAVLPRCGHLSHEEAPQLLLDYLQAFVLDLQAAAAQ